MVKEKDIQRKNRFEKETFKNKRMVDMEMSSKKCQRYVRKWLPRHGFKPSVIGKTAYTCCFRVGLGWSLGRVRVNVWVTPQWSEQPKKAVEVHTGCKSLLFLVSKLCVLE